MATSDSIHITNPPGTECKSCTTEVPLIDFHINENMELIMTADSAIVDQYNFNLNNGDLTLATS